MGDLKDKVLSKLEKKDLAASKPTRSFPAKQPNFIGRMGSKFDQDTPEEEERMKDHPKNRGNLL